VVTLAKDISTRLVVFGTFILLIEDDFGYILRLINKTADLFDMLINVQGALLSFNKFFGYFGKSRGGDIWLLQPVCKRGPRT
jgi:hypothetical protein